MDDAKISNCINCGAKLDLKANGKKCAYCCTDYSEVPAPVLPDATLPPAESVKTNDNLSAGPILFFIFLLVLVIGIIAANRGGSDTQSSAADSLTVDTNTTLATLKADSSTSGEDTYEQREIKALSAIEVDKPTFKRLYASARKKRDQFSDKVDIYDQTSPQYVNRNGIFAYIETVGGTLELRFCTQYYANDWLFIKEMTFNAGGENFYQAPDFKTDNGDGMIWEWSDSGVSEGDFAMLIKIATAKTAKVKYVGDKYYKIVAVTAKQQAALKRQLQIYKGLRLKYNK